MDENIRQEDRNDHKREDDCFLCNHHVMRHLITALLVFLGAFCAFYAVSDWHFKRLYDPVYQMRKMDNMMMNQERNMEKAFKRHMKKEFRMEKRAAAISHIEKTPDAYKIIIDLKPFDNDPKNVLLDSIISHRTKNFVNYYELIHHIPNTLSRFSATIFRDLRESNTTTNTKEFEKHFEYIIAFRGTEVDTKGILSDVLGADVSLATAGMAITQANALELPSKAIFRAIINHHTLSSKKENSHIYDKNLESIQDSYQSYKSIKEYFSSNNIKVTTTGHLRDTKTLDSIKVA